MPRRGKNTGGSALGAVAVFGIATATMMAAVSRASAAPSRSPGNGRGRRFGSSSPSPVPVPVPAHVPDLSHPSGTPIMDPVYTAATWLPYVRSIMQSSFPRLAARPGAEAFAMKWGEIESGWNPAAVGDPGQLGQDSQEPAEVGLGQLYNPDDFVHLKAPPVASFRAYAPEAAPLAAAYRQAREDARTAQAAGDQAAVTAAKARMAAAARTMQSRTRALTPDEMDAQVRWTLLAPIERDLEAADHVVAQYGLTSWSPQDVWALVKAPHALPAIIGNGMPAVVKKLGRAPSSWKEFRAVLGMDANNQWARALDACEACAAATATTVA